MAHLAPPNQNQSDAAALSCRPKAFLGGRVSFVTSLSSLWGPCPLSPARCTRPQAAPLCIASQGKGFLSAQGIQW